MLQIEYYCKTKSLYVLYVLQHLVSFSMFTVEKLVELEVNMRHS